MPPRPDLRHERVLLRAGAGIVVGMDEVGRGALAGPVSVGVVAVDARTRACPVGVADSKLLSPVARERLLPALGRWGVARAVGHAGPEEIDAYGIIAALRLAGRRAVAALGVWPDVVLLDGSHDWLSTPRQGGLDLDLVPEPPDPLDGALETVAVRTRIKADRSCASVAAASVLAKCERDGLMVALAEAHPEYGWAENKGYGAPEHLAALRALGPTPLHRCCWRLPLAAGDASAVDDGVLGLGDGLSAGAPEGAGTATAAEGDLRWSMMEA